MIFFRSAVELSLLTRLGGWVEHWRVMLTQLKAEIEVEVKVKVEVKVEVGVELGNKNNHLHFWSCLQFFLQDKN